MDEMEKMEHRGVGGGRAPPGQVSLTVSGLHNTNSFPPLRQAACNFLSAFPKGASDRGCRSPKQNRTTRSREEPAWPSTTLEIGPPAPAVLFVQRGMLSGQLTLSLDVAITVYSVVAFWPAVSCCLCQNHTTDDIGSGKERGWAARR
jgi:hypothetical protein